MQKSRKVTFKPEVPSNSRGPSRGNSTSSSSTAGDTRQREVAGVVALGAGIFLAVAMVSLQAHHALMGPFGTFCARAVYAIAGLCSYALVALMVLAAIRTVIEKQPAMPIDIATGIAIEVLAIATLLHLIVPHYRIAGYGPGGALGEHLAELSRAVISTAGTVLLAGTGVVIGAIVATPLRMRDVLGAIGRALQSVGLGVWSGVRAVGRFFVDVVRAILPERGDQAYRDEDERDDVLELSPSEKKVKEPRIVERGQPGEHSGPIPVAFAGDTEKTVAPDRGDDAHDEPAAAALAAVATLDKKRAGKKAAIEYVDATETGELPVVAQAVSMDPPTKGKRARIAAGSEAPMAGEGRADAPAVVAAAAIAAAVTPAPGALATLGPKIIESQFKGADKATMAAKEKQAEADRQTFIKLGDGEYTLPSIQFLHYDASSQNPVDKDEMLELSATLAQTLENYGVKGEVVAIRPGPVVTMFEFAPAAGVRVNKITNLSDDLALALKALRIRIVAPIPGKAAVGIEVPNRTREKVFLKEIIADEVFRKRGLRLPMALGKDIEGAPAVIDLASMPHLLVAGTTGSGKSVAVNAMITSLLYGCTPDEVRMIMVDPKMLELSIYEGIPHLLLPVVTDAKKANLALRWAVDEMERRYELLSHAGVRDISTYNEKVGKEIAAHEAKKLRRAADAAERAAGGDPETDDVVIPSAENDRGDDFSARQVVAALPTRLPFIVVVIDEFADLMMVAPKDVETSVARIAQKARAAGIHLILATQRPSVDVITGLIKANFPSRIAFSVASKIDSRTILDQSGAEALLGAGDMLFSNRGAAPVRLHGCYVDEKEIHEVVAFLKTQGRPVYNMDILKPRDEEGEEGGGPGAPAGGGTGDDMYDKAVYIVTTTRNASISWVQRQLRIGYNRAARIVEDMEKNGVVSAPDHTNKREVLVGQA